MTGSKTLFAITVGVTIVLGFLFHFFGSDTVWRLWNVPTLYPGFADLRAVLRGIDSVRGGLNSSTDSFGLVAGYPRIWVMLGWLGINASDTLWLAFVILFLYWISLYFFVRDYDVCTAVWMSSVVFSPAAMLAYERGNLDLVIFVLLAIALALDPFSRVLSVGLMILSAMLKVYPIVGLAYLLKEPRRRFFLWSCIGLSVFVIYAISLSRALKGVVEYIPRGSLFDYGAEVIGFHIFEVSGSRTLTDVVTLISFLALYFLIVGVLYWSYVVPDRVGDHERQYLDSFRLGAIIYIGTFVEGNSFNYRLIFLLFCIPQIIVWMYSSSSIRFVGRLALSAVVASCWGALLLGFLPVNLAFALDELTNWVLFAALLYLFFVSLPDWLLEEIDRFFQRYPFGRRKGSSESRVNHT